MGDVTKDILEFSVAKALVGLDSTMIMLYIQVDRVQYFMQLCSLNRFIGSY